MRISLFIFFLLVSTILFAQKKEAPKKTELTWPREINVEDHIITLYQAQLESFKGNILEGRMALSIKNKKEEIIFGAMWFKARLSTNLETRVAVLEDLEIPKVKFPDIEDQTKLDNLKKIIIDDLEALNLKMSLDRIISDIESVDEENILNDKLKNDPPEIYFRTSPTVLVIIDGDPILEEVKGTKLKSVINTPFLILKKKNNYYIKGGEYWYESKEVISNNWKVTKSVPNDVEKAAEKMLDSQEAPKISDDQNTEIPELIVTSKPSELIVSDGKLEYEPIKETSLLFVRNSENDIILDINSQHHFVLINGRWYSSKTMTDGNWKFIEPNALPKDFASIPADSDIASVKVSVPGTPEAQEAKYEQQMPQTAVVDRKTATTKVEYDGKPKFEKMEGTDVKYAVNTGSSVILVDKTYYCVDEGIWFESSKPDGPWKVSDSRPEEVEDIPPSAPVYNVKYVYIYDSTPEVVYVGYTPGYCNSYIYGGVVVYGTGYYYRPWYGAHYYPRPVTYGFGVHYNPYTGWGFSVGVSYGWFTMSMYHRHAYWGPAGYRHGYRHGYYHGYHHGYHNGYRAGYRRGMQNSRNIYSTRPAGIRNPTNTRDRASTMPANKGGVRPSQKPNNLYTDRNGNVYSRDKDGNWSQKNKRPATGQQPATRPGTKPSTRPATQPSTRPSTRPSTQPSTKPSTRPAPSNQLQRDYQNRSRGNTNYQNYQRSASPSNMNRSRPAPSRSPSPSRRR